MSETMIEIEAVDATEPGDCYVCLCAIPGKAPGQKLCATCALTWCGACWGSGSTGGYEPIPPPEGGPLLGPVRYGFVQRRCVACDGEGYASKGDADPRPGDAAPAGGAT
jgi:hypothetical protein